MVNPDDLSFLGTMFIATAFNISEKVYKLEGFPDEAVKQEFNADAGLIIMTVLKEGFGKGYKYCMMMGLYKKGLGIAFYFYMMNNIGTYTNLYAQPFHSLKFK